LSRSERRWRASVRNPARRMIIGGSPSRLGRRCPAVQLKVARVPTMGEIVTELKTPLTKRALGELMLTTGAAVASYQEQRLKLQVVRKARDNRQRAELTQTQAHDDNEIA
jgi:hypothetical protein